MGSPAHTEVLSTPDLITEVRAEVEKLEALISSPGYRALKLGMDVLGAILKLQNILEDRIRAEEILDLSIDLKSLVDRLHRALRSNGSHVQSETVANDSKNLRHLSRLCRRN